jgi:hypothetical protein
MEGRNKGENRPEFAEIINAIEETAERRGLIGELQSQELKRKAPSSPDLRMSGPVEMAKKKRRRKKKKKRGRR